MITLGLLERFLAEATGQALEEGERYARENRVGDFLGSTESLSTIVQGQSADFEVVLWGEGGALRHRCNCPSWRDPCKHEVAAGLRLQEELRAAYEQELAELDEMSNLDDEAAWLDPDPDDARLSAHEERRSSARREKLEISLGAPGVLELRGASGFVYHVRLRGDAAGPHGCDCPDFEANRLHSCKHVESARQWLRGAGRLSAAHRGAAERPRVFLYFGEVVEPRLLGEPSGPGSRKARSLFDAAGHWLEPLARHEDELLDTLRSLKSHVEPEALEWLERRREMRPVLPAGAFRDLIPPLRLTPYPFQWAGAEFLARRGRALLADEMGLGKTAQALIAAMALRHATPAVRRILVVCPASLRGGWAAEIEKWLGDALPVEALDGKPTQRVERIADFGDEGLLITHYEQLWRDFEAHAAHPPELLIVDEAQRAKGLRTRTARVLKAIPARHVFALTGTPLENRLEEAYAIAQLLDQRLLPPLWQIERDHFERDAGGGRVLLYRNLGELRRRLSPAFLRRRKEDVALELPERLRSIARLPMHAAVRATYSDVMSQVARLAARPKLPPPALQRLQRLLVIARRCCNGPQMLGIEVEDSKVPKLVELAQTLSELCLGEGRKAVVFSEWTDMTERVVAVCDSLGLPAFHLRGGIAVKKRPALIEAFTQHAGPAVFVSTDAGGTGLNLQCADVLINLDLPWNPARLEQRIARVHRIGSRRSVQVLLMITDDSVEARILDLHQTKQRILDNIWTDEGEDKIAAPGGSGAFKEMVRTLVATAPARAPRRVDRIARELRDNAGALNAGAKRELAAKLRALAAELEGG